MCKCDGRGASVVRGVLGVCLVCAWCVWGVCGRAVVYGTAFLLVFILCHVALTGSVLSRYYIDIYYQRYYYYV